MKRLAVVFVWLFIEACNQPCGDAGCTDKIEMCVPLASPVRIRVCRNTLCSEVQYQPSERHIQTGIGLISREGSCIVTEVSAVATNGDVYTLTGWDANDIIVDEYDWTATYEVTTPDGVNCGECLRPTLTEIP
ncbi:MAG: hypothetical protein ACKV2T_08165 [Kofleriaceae bacterium]